MRTALKSKSPAPPGARQKSEILQKSEKRDRISGIGYLCQNRRSLSCLAPQLRTAHGAARSNPSRPGLGHPGRSSPGLSQAPLSQVRETQLPLCCGRETRAMDRNGCSPGKMGAAVLGHSRRCRGRNPTASRPESASTDPGTDRGQWPVVRVATRRGNTGAAGKKGGLATLFTAETRAEVERLIGVGPLADIDFEAVETAAKRPLQSPSHKASTPTLQMTRASGPVAIGPLSGPEAKVHHRTGTDEAGARLVSPALPPRVQSARPRPA